MRMDARRQKPIGWMEHRNGGKAVRRTLASDEEYAHEKGGPSAGDMFGLPRRDIEQPAWLTKSRKLRSFRIAWTSILRPLPTMF
jgi:hypothetical protein